VGVLVNSQTAKIELDRICLKLNTASTTAVRPLFSFYHIKT